jgi:hypothetical protein
VSVWTTAQASPAAQRKGTYVPESTYAAGYDPVDIEAVFGA